MILERIGYGSNFNVLEIKDNKLIKQCKNEYGMEKIRNEISFYEYLITNEIKFNYPLIYGYDKENGKLVMNYLNDYIPLYKHFLNINKSEKIELLLDIFLKLGIIHDEKINVSKELYESDLIKESLGKINNRLSEIKNILNKYKFIKKVNGKELRSYDEIIERIQIIINNHLLKNKDYTYSFIHGDCQFNNILINVKNNDIKFIDPRGYYGDTKLFGIKEYDIAKVNFALSGYDIFDNMDVSFLDISNDNLNISDQIINKHTDLLSEDKFILALTACIWLGNAPMFKENELKCILSYKIALNFSTQYLF